MMKSRRETDETIKGAFSFSLSEKAFLTVFERGTLRGLGK